MAAPTSTSTFTPTPAADPIEAPAAGLSSFNIAYRNSIASDLSGLPRSVASQAREAPAIALRVASRAANPDAFGDAVREAFSVGMRYAIGLSAVLLVVGALFGWFRGASREEEVLEDELDASAEAELEISLTPLSAS